MAETGAVTLVCVFTISTLEFSVPPIHCVKISVAIFAELYYSTRIKVCFAIRYCSITYCK